MIETVKKLRWTPDIVYCSGWMSALAPIYLKKAYADTPFFTQSKIVLSLADDGFRTPFGMTFADKVLIDGICKEDVGTIYGRKTGYNELMKLAVDYSDAIVQSEPTVNSVVKRYAMKRGIPYMQYVEGNNPAKYLDFFYSLIDKA